MSSATERRQVFLACKAIFSGANALIRKSRTIRGHVEEHKASLRTLIPDFNVERVTAIAKELLKDGVFESDIKAQLIFPNLPMPSSARKNQHDASENEAARSTAKALKEAASGWENEIEEMETTPVAIQFEAPAGVKIQVKGETPFTFPPPPPEDVDARIPSLYPSYFPYHAQHSILSTLQGVLEECCFEFTKKWLPSELENRGWDCAVAVELTKWKRLLTMWTPQFPDGALQIGIAEFHAQLAIVCEVRHAAVHRVPTTARGIDTLVVSAMRLTEALRNPLRTSQLEDLHLDIQAKIKAMELNKNALEEDLTRDLEAIRLQREELDRKEEELRVKTINSDKENKLLMGRLVEESIGRIFNDAKGALDNISTGFATADDGAEDD